MTVTRDDVVTRVLNLLGSQDHLSATEVESLVQTRFEVLYESITWGKRVKDFTLAIVAQTASTSSTLGTATYGSSTFTVAGSPSFTSALIGQSIQIGSELQYFHVKDVPSSSTITLGVHGGSTVAWPNATDDELSWRMFKNLYALPADAASVISLAHSEPMQEVDGGRAMLDLIDPYRSSTNTRPSHWCYAGQEQYSSYLSIEVWPIPTSTMLLRGQYAMESFILNGNSGIFISAPLLVYATTADAAGLLLSKTGDQAWQALQLFYERKANEIEPDIRLRELEKHSPARSIGRARRGALRSQDYLISHHTDSLG